MENVILIVVVAIIFGITGYALGRLSARRDPDAMVRISSLEAHVEAAQENGRRLGRQSGELEHDIDVLGEQLDDAQQRETDSEERVRVMGDSKQALENAFRSLSAEALKSNNQQFLDLARASLAEFQQSAKGDLEKRQQAIDALVTPVKASLEKVDEKISALEKAPQNAYGEIRHLFVQMAEVQNLLRSDTTNLV